LHPFFRVAVEQNDVVAERGDGARSVGVVLLTGNPRRKHDDTPVALRRRKLLRRRLLRAGAGADREEARGPRRSPRTDERASSDNPLAAFRFVVWRPYTAGRFRCHS